jgi:acetyl-CoA carboxylase carboxyltransferase component
MSGAAAAKTLLQIKVATLKAKGEVISDEDQEKMLKDITDKYNEELSPYYAASRLWVDGIIDPLETRKVISMGIEAADHAPIEKPFNVGVIQT